jgi:SagB-type dehydrogenase family enzyme
MTADVFWTYALDAVAPRRDLPEPLRAAFTASAAGSTFDKVMAASVEAPGKFFELDAAGYLVRTLHGRSGPLATCHPRRAPDRTMPTATFDRVLRLSYEAVARGEKGKITLENPGAWARLVIHDPSVLPMLGALAPGCSSDACANAVAGQDADTVQHLLRLFDWCDLLDRRESLALLEPHETQLHVRTRLGYRRHPIGKTGQARPLQSASPPALATVPLPAVKDADAPSLDTVLQTRQSIRSHGDTLLSSEQLSLFLFRTFGNIAGHRPYPSAGGCYPLNGYIAIRSCQDVPPGLYAYRPDEHVLSKVAEPDPQLNQLLRDAAVAAAATELPQTLLIFSADFGRISPIYEGLTYSLVLKEVGAVIQTAMLAAAAAGLAACPLGTGNSLLFSRIAGLDPVRETSVAELMLGAP